MNQKILLLGALALIMFLHYGCNKKINGDYYTGTIEYLNNGSGCDDVLKIIRGKDTLPSNTYLSYNIQGTHNTLKIGDTIDFEILEINEMPPGFTLGICFQGKYIATIKLR